MRELGRLCRAFCGDCHTRWAGELNKFEELINSVVHETTGFAPRELQLGLPALSLLPASLQGPITGPADNESKLVLALETFLSQVKTRRLKAKSGNYPAFNQGDLVLLRSSPVSSAVRAEIRKFM